MSKWFSKGDAITIRESIKEDEWDDKNTGEKRTKLVFRVEEFWFEEGYDYQNHCWSERKPKGEKQEKQEEQKGDDDSPPGVGKGNIPF